MINYIKRLFATKAEPVVDDKPATTIGKVSWAALAKAATTDEAPRKQFEPYIPPDGVIPADKRTEALAMDSIPYDYINQSPGIQDYYFPGYPVLAAWAQLPEYRKMSETIAKEMTRKWIKLTSASDDDNTDKIKIIESELERLKVRDKFREAAELDGFFGRGQLYIDVKKPDGVPARADNSELEIPLILSPQKITKGSFVGLKVIEPVWTYPGAYNANDPLAPDYYQPSKWFIMGKTIHHSRMLMFVSREVPDLLKAAYNFGGLSLSQMAQPYVDHWIRTRNSVSDAVHSFSINGIKTDMEGVLMGTDDAQFFTRAQLFNSMRDNKNLMLLNKDTEEFFQYNVPLSGLDQLQAQSQEQMCSVSSIPLVKFTGITPSGLNASSDGEIRVFNDDILSRQENIFRDNLNTVIKIIQLSCFGEIDPHISFEFESLHTLNELEKAQVRKTDADTGAVLVASGAISPDEERARVASSDESGYNGLDIEEDDDLMPENPELDQRAVMINAKAKENA